MSAIDFLSGFALAMGISILTTPAGVSGAVFLAPAQLALLGTPSLQVTPTNLIYNVIAIPGGLIKFARDGSLWNPLTRILLLGTAPGMVAGAIIRSQFLTSPDSFHLVIAAVLLPLGIWMLFFEPQSHGHDRPAKPRAWILPMALIVGVIGGIYGIGGGSILAPVLVGLGYRVSLVAPAALFSTFATSIVGLGAFILIALGTDGSVAPAWGVGIAIGLGGLAGSYVGASLQPRFPEQALRRLLGILAIGIAATYTGGTLL